MRPPIERLLATVDWPDETVARLRAAIAPAELMRVAPRDGRAMAAALETADAALLKGPLTPRIAAAPGLRWVACDQSGLDAHAPPEIASGPLIVTSAAGRSAAALAQHALYFMLALAHRAPLFERARRRRVWGVAGQEAMRGLEGRRVLIVGFGHTGQALAPLCQALGMSVGAYRRRAAPPPVAGVAVASRDRGDALAPLLGDADVLVLAASLNDTSRGMIGAAEIAALPRGALLVNVARAGLVETGAMIAALRSGHLGGAGLDVADREPLPFWDPLWRAPNLVLTPHVTPRGPDRAGRSLAIFLDNWTRYHDGRPMLNRLMPEDAYSGPRPPRLPRGLWHAERLWRGLFQPGAGPGGL